MISFEEFKAEYKEFVDLQFAVAGAEAPNTYTMIVEFENMEDSQGGKHKRELDVHNSFAADFPTTFNLNESNINFLISLRGENEGEILNRFTVSTSEILSEKEFTLCKDLKVNGLYLYARFLIPENTYPMYNLTISAQNLPLLTGLFGDCDPFLRVLKKNTNFGTYHMVYESEVHRNTSSPNFKPIKLSLQRLCGGDHYREIKIQLWDFSKRGGHYIIGEFKTNLNNMILLNKNNTPIKLLSADGTKNHGTALIKELSPMIGPSLISKIYQGIKINLLNAIDTTGINTQTEDLTERLNFVTNFSKELVERIGFILNESKLQFFGLNGKCCTDNLYTNYVMDIFPISGDTKKNSFHYKQIKGDFFSKVMKNFMYNTEGGQVLNTGNFVRFAVDHCEETRSVTPFCYTIVVVYLWTIPADLNKMLTEFVSIKDKPIMFWIVYLGQTDMELIQTLDGRKSFIIDASRTISPTCKTMSICVSYKTEPHIAVRKLLIDTAQVFAYFNDK